MGVKGEGLLNVDVSVLFEAETREGEVGFGWGGDVDHVGPGLGDEFAEVGELGFHRETIGELLGHEWFAVADADDFAATDSLNLSGVEIGNLAATDDGDFKHAARLVRRLRHNGADHPRW